MPKFPEGEELTTHVCVICKGLGKLQHGAVCENCEGTGRTPWPRRCQFDCQKCGLPPVKPVFQVGDIVAYGNGGKGKIISILYKPCAGNYYQMDTGTACTADMLTKIEAASRSILDWF